MTLARTKTSLAQKYLYGDIRYALLDDTGHCHKIGPHYPTARAAIEQTEECTEPINAAGICKYEGGDLQLLRLPDYKLVLIDAQRAADESIYTDGTMHRLRAEALHRATCGVLMSGARVDLGSVYKAETVEDWKRLGIVERDGDHWRLTPGAAEAAVNTLENQTTETNR